MENKLKSIKIRKKLKKRKKKKKKKKKLEKGDECGDDNERLLIEIIRKKMLIVLWTVC